VGQWLLTSREAALPAGWETASHGRWTLACSRPLELLPLRDAAGRTLGWLIGHAVTEAGTLVGPGTLPVLQGDADVGEFVDRLNGRFVVVDARRADPLLYPDGLATLACVYSGAEDTVASTSGLIPDSGSTPFLVDRILAVDAPYSGSMYPLGLTPRDEIFRVIPNHVLDCGRWSLIRRWPRGPIVRDAEPAGTVDLFSSALGGALAGIGQAYPINVALTGGRDSRMMLACARPLASTTTLYTAEIGDLVAWVDTTIAGLVAARVGLPHRVLRGRTSARELATWVRRTAGETGEPRGWRAAGPWLSSHPAAPRSRARSQTSRSWSGGASSPWTDRSPRTRCSTDAACRPGRSFCRAPRRGSPACPTSIPSRSRMCFTPSR
jgi:hypothetical protein